MILFLKYVTLLDLIIDNRNFQIIYIYYKISIKYLLGLKA